MKLLTISIPTYNRCESCLKTVYGFISEIKANELENDVQIFVSDNCSEDKTWEKLSELKKIYPDLIELNRNETNLGMGKNFLICIDNCKTKYLWMPSDDDIYLTGIIRDTLKVLKENPNIIYMFMNCYSPVGNAKSVMIDKDFHGSMQDALKLGGICSTHISPTLVRADLVKGTPVEADEWGLWQKILRIKEEGEGYIFANPKVSFDPTPKLTDNWMLIPDKKALYFADMVRFCIIEKGNKLMEPIREHLLQVSANMINEAYGTHGAPPINPGVEVIAKMNAKPEADEKQQETRVQEVTLSEVTPLNAPKDIYITKEEKYKQRAVKLQWAVAIIGFIAVIETILILINV